MRTLLPRPLQSCRASARQQNALAEFDLSLVNCLSSEYILCRQKNMLPYRIVPASRPRLSTFMLLLLGMFAVASHVVGQKPGVSAATITGGQPVDAEVIVTNTGKVAGDEVAQLYLKFPQANGAPLLALCSFERVHLMPRDLGMVTGLGDPIIAPGNYTASVGGGQPNSSAPTVSNKLHVEGMYSLPE